jgi:hypothetical protein
MKNQCPCYNCLCLSVCRNKLWDKLWSECSKIKIFMQGADIDFISKYVQPILKPKRWSSYVTKEHSAIISKIDCDYDYDPEIYWESFQTKDSRGIEHSLERFTKRP